MVRYLTVLVAFIFILKLPLLNAQLGPWPRHPYGHHDQFDRHDDHYDTHHGGRGNHGGSNYCATLFDPTTRFVATRAPAQHSATVIFLHGLKNEGNIWPTMFEAETRDSYIKHIIPYAAPRPVRVLRETVPAWFDVYGFKNDSKEDIDGIEKAAKCIHSLIDAEISATNVPSKRIVLGGISMGGALALYAGMTYDKPLAGIIGLSTFLVKRADFPFSWHVRANRNVPIFMGHGTNDGTISFGFGNATKNAIERFSNNVQMETYEGMDHIMIPQELEDVRQFLAKCLPPQRLHPNAGRSTFRPYFDDHFNDKYRPYGRDQH